MFVTMTTSTASRYKEIATSTFSGSMNLQMQRRKTEMDVKLCYGNLESK